MAPEQIPKNGYISPKVERLGSAQVCDPARPTTVVWGGKGRKRLEFMRLPHEDHSHLLSEETLWKLLEPWDYGQGNCFIERKVIYTFKARWADRFYKNKVLLAGDALHLMPPFIGQGLNSGFRDAAALSWRLPLLLSGVASEAALLQSYENERGMHVRSLTEYCVKLGGVVCELDPQKSASMHKALRDNRSSV
ncbi:hypothetical protein EMMF5_006606, partial [Cystobasidiomycetes sp. EMM_F5]